MSATLDLGLCSSGYCDNEAVGYVANYLGRLVVIFGIRAGQLGAREPVELRCRECAHNELDRAMERMERKEKAAAP